MKKYLIFSLGQIALLFCLVNIAQAQLELGLHLNKNIGQANFLPIQEQERSYRLENVGFSTGLIARQQLENIDISFGVLYNRMDVQKVPIGWCATPPLSIGDLQTENIVLQSSLRYRFLTQKGINPFVSLGVAQFIRVRYVSPNGFAFFSNRKGEDDEIVNVKNHLALLSSVGLKFKLDDLFSFELESSVQYYFGENISYKNKLAFGFGATINRRIFASK